MLTDEQAQELQAANVALRQALERYAKSEHWRKLFWPGTGDVAWEYIPALPGDVDPGIHARCTLANNQVEHDRLALERATVRALRQRLADVAHVEPEVPCTCARCERDRALLAQWAVLGVEA